MPDPVFYKNQFASDRSTYEANVKRFGRRDVVDLTIGDARETLPGELSNNGFCVAFLDVDTYEVTRDLFFKLWDVSIGGETINVHDIWSPGVRKSIDEFHKLSGHSIIETKPETNTVLLVIPAD